MVESLDPPDSSVEAHLCAQFAPKVLDKIFSSHQWSFLRVRDKLSKVVNEKPHPPYRFIYAYPSDAEHVNFIFDAELMDYPRPFVVESNKAGDKFICTNAFDAWAEYQMYGDKVKVLPPLVEDAFVNGLAFALCGALVKGTTGAQLANNFLQLYEISLSRAKDHDADEGREYMYNFMSDFERARYS